MEKDYLISNHYTSLNPKPHDSVTPEMLEKADRVMDFLEKHPLTTLMIACRAVTKMGHNISTQSFQNARRKSPTLADRYAAFKNDKLDNNICTAEKAMMKRIKGFKMLCVERTLERQIVTDPDTGKEKEVWVVTKEKQVEKYFPPSEKLIEFYLETKGNYIKVIHVENNENKNAKVALSPEKFFDFLKEQGIENVTPIYEAEDDGSTS